MNVADLTSSRVRRLPGRMRPAVALGLTLGWLIALGASATAQSVQLVPFGGQDYDTPFHVTGVPGDPDRVFVVEAAGTIRLVKSGVTQSTPFLDISADVWDINEGGCECGLFSMAPAPDYASSGRFYVFYTRDIDPGFTTCESRNSAARPQIPTSPTPPAAGSCSKSRTSTPPTTTAASSNSAPTACSMPGSVMGDP